MNMRKYKERKDWSLEREESKGLMKNQAKVAMADYLEQKNWDYFITVTTRKEWIESHSLIREAWKCLQGVTACERAFLCTEPYYNRSGVHLHGIVKADEKYKEFVPTKRIWGNLFTRFGRSKVELARSNRSVTSYCSKYVVKSEGDYELKGLKRFW